MVMGRFLVALVVLALVTDAHAATITGHVVQDGFRVAEYAVFLRARSDAAMLVQDSAGRFILRDVPPGKHRLALVGWAFAPTTVDVDVASSNSEVVLGAITVERGRALAGRVVDAAGTPVDGATVLVYEARPIDLDATPLELMVGGAQLTTSRHDGTYTVHGLPEDPQGLRVLAFGDDMVSAEHLLGTGSWRLDLAIGQLGTIVGTVTNRRQMESPFLVAKLAGGHAKPTLAGVDPSGAFRLDLPAGVYELHIAEETAAPIQVVVVGNRTRTVKLTAPTRHVDLVVESAGCIYIRLLGARPRSKVPRTEIAFELCDGNTARFPRLAPGPYRLCVDTDEESACKPLQLRASPARRVVRLPVVVQKMPSH
jgi:hypothetical protein